MKDKTRRKGFWKRFGVTILATLCLVTTMQSLGNVFMSASAAQKQVTEPENLNGFPSTAELVKKAAQLLGTPYNWGAKGIHDMYNDAGQRRLYSASEVKSKGIDCSGLLYWTMASMGYQTSGFGGGEPATDYYGSNCPVPSYSGGWVSGSNQKISFKDATRNTGFKDVEWQKTTNANQPSGTNNTDWWKMANGKDIEPGSIVVSMDASGDNKKDHCWIYIGVFANKEAVLDYLVKLGFTNRDAISPYVNDKTAANRIIEKNLGHTGVDSKTYTHWRIESNGTEGVRINNGIDAKTGAALKVNTSKISNDSGSLEITKYIDKAGEVGAQVATQAVYPDFSKLQFALKVKSVQGMTTGKYVQLSRKTDGSYRAVENAELNNYTEHGGVVPLNADGKIHIDDLLTGTYTIVETTDYASLGLEKPIDQDVVIKADTTTTATPITITNYEQTGSISIIKQSVDVLGDVDDSVVAEVISNAEFVMCDVTASRYVRASGSAGSYKYLASDRYDPTNPAHTEAQNGTKFKLGSDGKITITGLPLKHEFKIMEISTAKTYTLDPNFKNASVAPSVTLTTSKKTNSVTIQNTRKSASVTVTKIVKDLQGNEFTADLTSDMSKKLNSAVVFKLVDWNGKYIVAAGSDGSYFYKGVDTESGATEFTLASDGTFSITGLPTTPEGKTYSLVETKTADGFKLADPKNVTLTTNTAVGIPNEESPTKLEVTKEFLVGDIGKNAPVKDEEYEKIEFVVKNSKGEFVIAAGEAVNGIYKAAAYTKDESKATVMHLDKTTHKAVVDNLSKDSYKVIEKVDTSKYVAQKGTVDANSSEGDATPAILINKELVGGFEIYKKTATMKNVNNIQFRIHGVSASNRDIDVRTSGTDASGYIKVEGLPYGEYDVEECSDSVPEGYALAEPMHIIINKPFQADDNKVVVTNDFYSGEVKFTKKNPKGTGLEGFKFALTAEEDIYEGPVAPENLLYKKGEQIETITTDSKGNGVSTYVLPYGYKYTLKEIEAAAPYVNDSEPITFTLKEVVDQQTNERSSVYVIDGKENDAPLETLSFEDNQQEGKLTIYKVDEKNEKVMLDGAEFDIIANENIVVNGEIKYKQNDVVAHVTTKNGKAEAKLYTGYQYGLKETKAPNGYVLSDDITKVDMKYEPKLLYTEKNVSVKNGHQKGNLTIYKVDKDDNKVFLEGAEFDIIAKTDITVSGDEHKAGDIIAHIKTDKDGKASYELWTGYTYVLKETKAPTDYEKSDKVIEISVDYNPNIKCTETNVRVENQRQPDKPRVIPKTGVTSSIVPVVAAALLACGAAVAVFFLLKKKKKSR